MAAPRPTAPWIGRSAVFALAALVAVVALGAWLLYRQAFEQGADDARRAVRVLEEHADKIIGGQLAFLEQVEWLARGQSWTGATDRALLHGRLNAIQAARPEVQSLWLFDAKGDVIATSLYPVPPVASFADRDYFKAALRGEDRFIGPVIVGRLSGEYSFNLMRRIANPEGSLRGVLIVSLRPEYFMNFYDSVGKPGDAVMLLHADGALLARHPRPAGDLSRLRASDTFMLRLIAGQKSGLVEASGQFGSGDYLYAVRPVVGLPIFVVYGAAQARILAEWRDEIVGYSLFAVPALFGVAALGWIAYRVGRMADQSRRRLYEMNLDLERRVDERTAALAESEEVLRSAVEAAELGTWEIEIGTGWSRWSEGMRAILGLPEGMTEGGRADRVEWFHPDDRAKVAAQLQAHIERGEPYRLQFRFIRPDGDVRWLASFGNTLPADGDRPARIVGVIQDITERKRNEERQQLLMAELDHRVRNMMAVIQALARQSLKGAPDDADVFTQRIASLARVHSLLAANRWRGADLRALVEGLADTYRSTKDSPTFAVSGPAVHLPPKVAQSMALVLQELSGNAAKYGALSVPEGRVEVTWRRTAGDEGERLALTWREQDGPAVVPPKRRGFGTRFIEATIRYDLRGAIDLDYAGDGLVATIDIPRPSSAADEPVDPGGPAPGRGRAGTASYAVLAGRRILVVEDEQLVADETAAALTEAGVDVLGPVGRPQEALDLLRRVTPDAAVLDVNLAGELVWPVAEALRDAGVPLLLVTGYQITVLPQAWRQATCLTKPVGKADLLGALSRLIATDVRSNARPAG